MNKNVDDKIGDVLDVEVVEVVNPPSPLRPVNSELLDDDGQMKRDFEYTRENIMTIIETGNKSLEELFDLARQAQNARAFEVIASLIKTLADANKDLLDLHKKSRELDPQSVSNAKTVNQNLFVGSTKELMQMIKDADKDG
jgi:hypothetical protein